MLNGIRLTWARFMLQRNETRREHVLRLDEIEQHTIQEFNLLLNADALDDAQIHAQLMDLSLEADKPSGLNAIGHWVNKQEHYVELIDKILRPVANHRICHAIRLLGKAVNTRSQADSVYHTHVGIPRYSPADQDFNVRIQRLEELLQESRVHHLHQVQENVDSL